ncbi:MAG TPA: tetratricopeptide repeat protein [Pirellulales bacterium]|jgi:tetratricopeptide (TPR) repeat protein|nr:tetratricopeptide repeat protein [Pirellulales bacterium]
MTTASQTQDLPIDIDALVVMAEREHRARRFSQAAATYGQIVALRPDVAEAYNNLGNVFKDLGQLDEAAARYELALALKPSLVQAYNNLGNVLREQGKLDEAVARYEQALAVRPDLAAVHVNLGGVLKDQGKLDEAAIRFERALALDPSLFQTQNVLGNIYCRQAKFDQAAVCFERAIAIKPNYATAHKNLGCVLAQQGRLHVAVAPLESAVALKPGLFQAHVTLGCIFQKLGKLDRAAASFRQAIALRPNNAEGHHTLGKVLRDLGQLDEACAEFERAITLKPELFPAHNSLGCALQEQEKLDRAVACYQQALAINADYAEAHHNLGVALKQLGRFDEAALHFDRAIALWPDYAEAHFGRVELKPTSAGDPELAALEALAADAGRLPPDKMIFIHFALGMALEDAGDYARAFDHFQQGNALKRGVIHYDDAVSQRDFRLIAEFFDSGLLDRFPAMGDPSPAPIFIVGMPRSGSTLVEQILASHPQVHAAGELDNLNQVIRKICVAADGQPVLFPQCLGTFEGDRLARLGQAYLASLPALADGKIRITDKMLGNFFRVGLIRMMLPNARIIHTVRDPVDTCLSCFSKLFVCGHGFSYDLAELGAFYRGYHQLMTHWRSVLPAGAMLEVSYEDVIDNQEHQARRLIEYCGLPWDDRCLDFHKHDRPILTASNVQVRQPLYRSSVARWRRYAPYIKPLLAQLDGCDRASE